jgi:hypothetical protein
VRNSKLTPGNITILVAGVVMILASFLSFYKISLPSVSFGNVHLGGSKNYSAWAGSPVYLLGVATFPALLGLIMAVHVALTSFANVGIPDRVAGFTWNQIHLVLALQCVITMLAFLIRDKSAYSYGIGFVLMLLAAVALLVGAIMRSREPAPTI